MINARLLFLLFISLTLQGNAQDTTRYYNDLGKFWVYFPEKPFVEFEDQYSATQDPLTMFSFKAKELCKDTLYYIVTYFDIPSYSVNNVSHESAYGAFDEMVHQSIDSLPIKIINSVTDETVPFISSKEYNMQFEESKELVKMKYYMCENRVYYLTALYKPVDATNPALNRFFDSFEIEDVKWRVRLTDPRVEEAFKKIEIRFPSIPLSQADPVYRGNIAGYRKIASTSSVNYMAVILILPGDINQTKGFKAKKEYEKMVKELQDIPNTTVIYQKEVSSYKNTGCEIKFTSDGMTCLMRIFYYKDMCIKLTVSYMDDAGAANENAINDYFNSFVIKE